MCQPTTTQQPIIIIQVRYMASSGYSIVGYGRYSTSFAAAAAEPVQSVPAAVHAGLRHAHLRSGTVDCCIFQSIMDQKVITVGYRTPSQTCQQQCAPVCQTNSNSCPQQCQPSCQPICIQAVLQPVQTTTQVRLDVSANFSPDTHFQICFTKQCHTSESRECQFCTVHYR